MIVHALQQTAQDMEIARHARNTIILMVKPPAAVNKNLFLS